MERYSRQYPNASILLFEPDREDADMFFANIFSYWQRKRLCAIAFAKTRQNLVRARATRWRRYCAAMASRSGTTAWPTPAAMCRWRSPIRVRCAGRGTPGRRPGHARVAAHARPARAGGGGRTLIRGSARRQRGHHGRRKRPAPHPRAHPRDQPRAVQSAGRAAHHDGGHRRRDEHQPGQPLLSLPQQGRHHRRALRRLRSARFCRCCRPRRTRRRASRTCGSCCTCCSSGCAITAFSTATWTRSRRAIASSRCASPTLPGAASAP